MQEIADLTKMSKFAVSRAISGKPGVSAGTRDMILKTAGQLGYFKNDAKKSSNELQDYNVQLMSGTILVLFSNVKYQNQESEYWGAVFNGISTRLNQKGIDILTITEPTSDRMFSVINPEAIRGIITVGVISTSILLEIDHLNIPTVMVDHLDSAFLCDTVFTDNMGSMKHLTTKLISKGYKKFQFVGNIDYAQSFFERWLSFRATLEQFEIPHQQLLHLIGLPAEEIHIVMKEISEEDIPEVFVCANDSIAHHTIETLKKRGILVPDHCAVTGFDNTNDSSPILATVNVNKEILGMRAVDQILWRIVNKESSFEKKLICGDIIIR